MIHRKLDSSQIEAKLEALKTAPWLGSASNWWPHFVFHFTDIQNVVSILTSGRLLARSQCAIATDIASADVIANTSDTCKDHVRLYFRPRTPTQYHNEGIRPQGGRSPLNAHCPVPVFLLFDAKDVLTRNSTCFSEGNLAANSSVGNDSAYFALIPFEKVYHEGPLGDAEKRSIVFHRHAEVLVPNEMDLASIKHIICRSEAETETLRNLLHADVRQKFDGMICEARRANLFFRRWTFVETASLEQQRVVINFNPSTQSAGPLAAHLSVTNLATGATYKWENTAYFASGTLVVGIPQLTEPAPYTATLTLDGATAFAGRFNANLMF